MPLSPKRVIHRKVQRGREKGNATRDNHIDFGDIALVAMEPTWLDTKIIEAARVAINRKLDRKGNVWIRVFPDKPITKKPAEVRMGKGKGAPDHWAAVKVTFGFVFSQTSLLQRNQLKFVWVRVRVLQIIGQLLSNRV